MAFVSYCLDYCFPDELTADMILGKMQDEIRKLGKITIADCFTLINDYYDEAPLFELPDITSGMHKIGWTNLRGCDVVKDPKNYGYRVIIPEPTELEVL